MRAVRWAVAAAAVCVVVAVAAVAYSVGKAKAVAGARTVTASRFQVVDDRGKVRAALALDGAGPGLTLYDAEGRLRADVRLGQDGSPHLGMAWETGEPCAALALEQVASGTRPTFGLLGKQGSMRLALSLDPQDTPKVIMYDRNGTVRAAFTLRMGDGNPECDLFDERGRMLWRAP